MFFKQFYLQSLGHASYLIGDERTGKALVVDPRRDVGIYFDEAREQGLRIVHAIDTHGHNDYLSGLTELALRQDVDLLGYTDAHLGYDHTPVKDGQVIELDELGFEIIHTPGHTPEHVSLVVYDGAAGPDPALLLSGGALLVGDIGRPDLLGGPAEAKEAARVFCHTIQERILWRLPDHLLVFPTHVSGSLCGGNIGSRLSTTVGYEKKTNAVVSRISSTEEFVEECIRLDNLPAVPSYWRRMRKQNLEGVNALGVLAEPPALRPDAFRDRQRSGAIVVDARSPEAFAGGHIPNALNVGLGSSFATWAGSVLPEDAEVLLVLDGPEELWDAAWQLLRIGYELPVGWLAGGMFAWRAAGYEMEPVPTVTVRQLLSMLETSEVEVLDVRQPSEWMSGHIPGATFITAAELPDRIADVPRNKPVAVVCGSGYRSSVATSLLKRHGIADVLNVSGGMSAWNNSGFPTER